MLSYCALSETPAFRNLVTELTPKLGDRANMEAFRDYMEYNGVLRDYSDIVKKLENNYFSTIKPNVVITGGQDNEITDMNQSAKFKSLGISVPKKQISQQQINNLNKIISQKNNELFKQGVNRVFRLFPKQVGEVMNDNFTWELKVFRGKLDVEGKAENARNEAINANRLPSVLDQGALDNQMRLFTDLGYGELRGDSSLKTKIKNVNYETDRESIFRNRSKTLGDILSGLSTNSQVLWFESGRGGISMQTYTEQRKNSGGKFFLNRDDLSYTSFPTGRTIEEEFNRRDDDSLFGLVLAARLLQKTDSFLGRVYSSLANKGSQASVGIENDPDQPNHFYFDGERIMINLYRLGVFMDRFDNYDAFTKGIELILTEEVIHGVVSNVSTSKDMVQIYDELTKEELSAVREAYKGRNPSKYQIAHEYIRMVLQNKFFGTTSDVETKPALVRLIKKALNYLINVFKSNPTRISNIVIKRVETFVKQTEAITPQNELTEFGTVTNFSQQIIRKMADAMKEQVGVDYAFITEKEAEELTKNAANKWSGQNSFFFEGKAFFIEGSLTPDDILHEFVHPIMRSLSKQNRPLFDSLYDKAALSEEGSKIIEDVIALYPDLDIQGDDFKEEVLVRALAKIQDLNNQGLEVTAKFEKFVNDLLYAIKQFLRKIFGQKIKVSELSPQTTLEGLSKMLEEGGSFELDPEIITNKDLVAYKNEYTKYMEDFVAESADQKEIEKLANDYFNTVAKQLQSLREKNDLGALADILQNEYKTGELQKMKQNLKSYQTLILQDAKKMEDEVELTRQRTQAIINSLGNVDNMVQKIYEGLRELVKDVDNPDNVQRALYYQKVLNYWSDFVNTANTTLERNGIDNIKMVNNVTANTRKANDLMDDFYRKASQGVLWEKLKASAENIEQKWKTRIAELTAKNAPAEIIAKANADYQNEKITPEMIEKALKGELKDLNFANAYLEGYGYSPDPVVGGLALFVKDKITEVEATAQKNFNEAAVQLKPLLDKVGYNPNNPGKLGQDLGQKEKVGRVNPETGEFEEVEVWRFLNEFTGADIARDQYLFKIKTASAKYNETGKDEDKKALADIQAEWEQHRRDFFHNEYTEPFYQAYDILKKDAIGNEARMQMNNLYDELNLLSGQMIVATASDVLEIADQIEVTRRQIKQLSSLYDLAGNLKTGDDLEIAKRLQEFNEAVKDLYESEEIPGAFETALQSYEQKLLDEGKKKGETDYETLRSKWLEKNTRVAIKETFWTKMDMISKAINDILSTLPQQDSSKLEIEEAYKVIKDMVKGNRDESGQPLGSEMSPERQEKVKAAQERINEARENLNKLSGLNKQEQGEVSATMLKYQMGQKVSAEETARLNELLGKQAALKLDKVQRAELTSLFAEMDELRAKEATDSYVDTVNDLLSAMPSEAVYDILKSLTIDKSTAFLIGTSEVSQRLIELSPEFEEWFNRNHIMRESVDQGTNEIKEVWDRTYAWNVIKPRDEKYYEKTTIKNAQGETITLDGLPSLKYFKRLVKDAYLTKKIEGVTVDNRGYWLPKNMQQGAKDDRYINKEYARIRQVNPDMFTLLEKMKEIHLRNQKGLNKKAKLYLDMPRYRKQTVERLRSENPVQRIVDKVKTFWTRMRDGFDSGFNYSDNMQLVKMDLFDSDANSVPITGLSNLPIEEVSTDIAFTSLRYMLSAIKNKQLTEIAPFAKAIQQVINNEKNHPLETKILNNSTLVFSDKKKSKYLRQKAVNNFIEKTFQGQVNTGWGSESTVAQNFSNALFKQASGAFLSLNIPSALKNSIGQKFQGLIESAAGRYMSTKDFLAAEGWATATTFKISGELYKQGPKSLDIQITELFDPERGRFEHQFGEALTRTVQKDYSFLILQRMTDFRKFSQLQASLQTFAGMMKHQLVEQNGKMIPYLEAWEIKDNKIQLKEGIDPAWGVSYDKEGNMVLGSKFKQKRNEIHRVMDNLNGAMSQESRPEADRYLLFRYVSFFRRYLTSMLTNRFAKNRADYQLGDFKEGFYWTFLKLMANSFKTMGKNLPHMSSTEKAAALRFLTEAGTVAIIKFLVIPIILGFDSDDEDRFKKLRARSGALPWIGVSEDPTRPFDFSGWLGNHILLNIMQVESENQQFLPFPGAGLSQYKQMLDVKSMVFGPTVKTWFDIIQDTANLATGDESAYYQRTTGPYSWQSENSAKIFNHIAKAFGVTGANIDPAVAIRNFQAIQNR